MAEKGELICDNSVSPSPAATPRQSMTEVESGKQTSDGTTPSPARSSSEQNQEVKAKPEQPEAEANTKGSNTCTTPVPLPPPPHSQVQPLVLQVRQLPRLHCCARGSGVPEQALV